MKILCFGNPYIEKDSLAIKIGKELKNHEIIICESTNDLLYQESFDYILDVAEGIKKTTIIEDVNKLKENKLFSLHDFDLSFFLKLMQKIGRIDKIKIIAVPMNYEKEKAIEEVKNILEKQ
jgi:Ni,Fe-hydrogenase maturation factor